MRNGEGSAQLFLVLQFMTALEHQEGSCAGYDNREVRLGQPASTVEGIQEKELRLFGNPLRHLVEQGRWLQLCVRGHCKGGGSKASLHVTR